MTRIAVIGNSHTGPLMWSWHETLEQARPDITVDFFRGHTIGLCAMTLAEDKRFGCLDRAQDNPDLLVHTMKYNMRVAVDLNDYDVVISTGWWFTDPNLIATLLARFQIDGLNNASKGGHMSAAAFEAILNDQVEKNLPPAGWHNWTKPRLLHMAAPRLNETSFDLPLYKEFDRAALPVALDLLSELFAKRLGDLGIKNVPQPTHTIGAHGHSLSKYGRSPRNVIPRKAPAKQEYAHMNADYGLEFWADIFDVIGV